MNVVYVCMYLCIYVFMYVGIYIYIDMLPSGNMFDTLFFGQILQETILFQESAACIGQFFSQVVLLFFQRRRPFQKERCTFWRSLWTYLLLQLLRASTLKWWYTAWRSTAHSSRTVSLLWRVFPTVSVVSATPYWKNIVVTIQHCGLSSKYTFVQLYFFKRAMSPFKKIY